MLFFVMTPSWLDVRGQLRLRLRDAVLHLHLGDIQDRCRA